MTAERQGGARLGEAHAERGPFADLIVRLTDLGEREHFQGNDARVLVEARKTLQGLQPPPAAVERLSGLLVLLEHWSDEAAEAFDAYVHGGLDGPGAFADDLRAALAALSPSGAAA